MNTSVAQRIVTPVDLFEAYPDAHEVAACPPEHGSARAFARAVRRSEVRDRIFQFLAEELAGCDGDFDQLAGEIDFAISDLTETKEMLRRLAEVESF